MMNSRFRRAIVPITLFLLLFLADLALISFGDLWGFAFPGNLLAGSSKRLLDTIHASWWNEFISALLLPCVYNGLVALALIYGVRRVLRAIRRA